MDIAIDFALTSPWLQNLLLSLLNKNSKFVWSDCCVVAFAKKKVILVAPDFYNQFKLCFDASDVGCRNVLMQDDEDCTDYPVGYFI